MAKIMLVDDAAFMRMMEKDVLVKNGYDDIVEACDGAEAVQKHQKYGDTGSAEDSGWQNKI